MPSAVAIFFMPIQRNHRKSVALEDALSFFYDSDTYKLISEGVADMHCRSDEYLADELMMEYKETRESGGNDA